MKKYVIIVAGGTGKRMKAEVPKQFLHLKNKPILCHTINRFYTYDSQITIILVVPKNQMLQCKDPIKSHDFRAPHKIVNGGSKRFFSVKNGLNEIPEEEGLVAIHDGVRPLVALEVIQEAFETANKHGNAIPALGISESVREITADGNRPINREQFLLIQTPQVFKISLIKEAYQQKYQNHFTDDATVLESIGEKIRIIQGNPENIKITTPHDMKVAEALMDAW